jgi:hypothetical protein
MLRQHLQDHGLQVLSSEPFAGEALGSEALMAFRLHVAAARAKSLKVQVPVLGSQRG